MIKEFFRQLNIVISDSSLRKKILFILGILAVFRIGTAIPIPGVDPIRLQAFFTENQFLGLLNIFSGGTLSNLSIMMLGLAPYITAVIIMQLLTLIFPGLKALYHEEGEAGRQKFNQYGRLLTVPLAALQGFGLITLLIRQGVLEPLGLFGYFVNILIVMAGAVFLMWLGELISEYGIGNGVSILIFAGIVAGIPSAIGKTLFTYDPSQLPIIIAFVIIAAIMIAGVVLINEGQRPIPISYAKQIRGMRMYGGLNTYLPMKINQAGVIPIIFAISILLFPQMIANFLGAASSSGIINTVSNFMINLLNNSWFYAGFYFTLVFLFTYFYTAVTFDPEAISKNLQKQGAFVPGIRPGNSTSEYLYKILNRITLIGAISLGLIAVLPLGIRAVTGLAALTIGGTAILIVVAVILDTIKKIQAQIAMREYE